MNKKNKDWSEDYNLFLNSESVSPPPIVTENIKKKVFKDLNPSIWRVFFKLSIIQVIVGSISLILCPQFGITMVDNLENFHFLLHHLGEVGCMLVCGFIFVGVGAFTSSLILNPSEVLKIQFSRLGIFSIISIFSLGIFYLMGGRFFLEMAIFWFLGSIVGGFVTFKIGRLLRFQLNR